MSAELLPCVFVNMNPRGFRRCREDSHVRDCPAHYRPAVAERLRQAEDRFFRAKERVAALEAALTALLAIVVDEGPSTPADENRVIKQARAALSGRDRE